MAKINRFATSEIEGTASSSTVVPPLGMHFDSSGSVFFSNGSASSKKFITPGKIFGNEGGGASGLDTLKLIPDASAYDTGSTQFVVVDSAGSNRVHLRAGGTLDAATTQLYIGGTKNFIKVDDSTNAVTIGTRGTDVDSEWTFSDTGSLNLGTAVNFTSQYPISFAANLDANTFIVSGTSSSFDGGTGWEYDVIINSLTTGIVTVSLNNPLLASNIGYKVGDTFSFGPGYHGIRGYNLNLTVDSITENLSPAGFYANLIVGTLPVLETSISSAKPLKINAGTANIVVGTDGSINLNSGGIISEEMINSRNSIAIKPSTDSDATLLLASSITGGNTAIVTTANLAEIALTIGTNDQGVKLKVDGNVEISSANRDDGTTKTWKFISTGKLSSQDDSFYIQQPSIIDNTSGLFTLNSSALTVSSGLDLILQAGGNASTWTFTASSEIKFPNNSILSGVSYANSYPGIQIITDANTNPTIGLAVYTSNANLTYVTPADSVESGLVFGSVGHQVALPKSGDLTVLSRTGRVADPTNTVSATRGGNVYITAGSGGGNAGDPVYGEEGGHVFIDAGFSTKDAINGGSIALRTGAGYNGFGNLVIQTNGNDSFLFENTGNLTVPGSILPLTDLTLNLGSRTNRFRDIFGNLTLPNSAVIGQANDVEITDAATTYTNSLTAWEDVRASYQAQANTLGITSAGWPFIAWNATGTTAAGLLSQLTTAWQIQNGSPSSPPTPLIFVPAISSATYQQIRSTLTVVLDTYTNWQALLTSVEITAGTESITLLSNGKLQVPNIIQTDPEEDLVIRTRYAGATSPGGSGSGSGALSYAIKDFTFGTNGSLTFPDGTIQTTAYSPVTGSWTLTPGTNTVSFTVPPNGAYHMWVRGNIPNGIISYVATVHVTNPNVPVIGSQRGYNYTDGGSPILLTSMPSQFVGTEGTIATGGVVGTRNNEFIFGISNTTGTSQTIYWGYTKI